MKLSQTTTLPPEFQSWPGHTGNWDRWANDRGTLNMVTPDVTLRGLQAAIRGQVVNCARIIRGEDPARPTPGAKVDMITAGDQSIEVQSAKCQVTCRTHGRVNTHIDAMSHYGFHNHGFNGGVFSDFVSEEKLSLRWDVTNIGPVVTRGVFVDIARRRGVSNLQPGEAVRADELEEVTAQLLPGDAIVIRTGATLSPIFKPAVYHADPHEGATCAGLDPPCVELLASRDVSLIATDTPNECLPVQDPAFCRAPVHVLALVFYGIHLVHNLDLEELGELAAAEARNTFLFALNPLRLPGATGSLVSPLVVF